LLSLGLVPLTLAPFVGQSMSPVMDALLGSAVVLHSHIGFDSCITDYFPKRKWGGLNKSLGWLLRGCTALVLYGVYSFETNDVGITEAVARMWKA
jgi:succinate dehydrogenase (ubiquinone) membrane anchor subunit